MNSPDTCCSLAPYFKVNDGQLAAFKALCQRFEAKTRGEPGCVYYAFSFDGDSVHCREGYDSAAALLAHLDNVGALVQEALTMATISRLEVHAPAAELAKLREPMAGLAPTFFTVEGGLRR